MKDLTEEQFLTHLLRICQKFDKREHNTQQDYIKDSQTTMGIIFNSVYDRLAAVEKELINNRRGTKTSSSGFPNY